MRLSLLSFLLISILFPAFSTDPFAIKLMKDGKEGYANEKGELIVPAIYYKTKKIYGFSDYLAVKDENGWGILDSSGKMVFNTIYKEILFKSFNEGIWVKDQEGYVCKGFDGKEQRLDNELIPVRSYYGSKHLKTNYCVVKNKDHKYGLIDSSFEIQIKPIWDKLEYLNNDLLIYVEGINKGLMNYDGEIILRADKYNHISILGNGQIILETSIGSIIVNEQGAIIETADGGFGNPAEGFYIVWKSGTAKIHNWESHELMFNINKVEDVRYYDGLLTHKNLVVMRSGKWGVINIETQETVLPFEYVEMEGVSNPEYFLKRVASPDGQFNSKVMLFDFYKGPIYPTDLFWGGELGNGYYDYLSHEKKIIYYDANGQEQWKKSNSEVLLAKENIIVAKVNNQIVALDLKGESIMQLEGFPAEILPEGIVVMEHEYDSLSVIQPHENKTLITHIDQFQIVNESDFVGIKYNETGTILYGPSGKELVQSKYTIQKLLNHDLYVIEDEEGNLGIVNRIGDVVLDIEYNMIMEALW